MGRIEDRTVTHQLERVSLNLCKQLRLSAEMVKEVLKRARNYAVITGGDSKVASTFALELLRTGWHVVLAARSAQWVRILVHSVVTKDC